MTQPLDPDLTPEWLLDIDALTALDNLIYAAQAITARMTMFNQRLEDLRILMQGEKDGTKDTNQE